MSTNRGHRAGQCAPEVPRTRIRARGDLQEVCHGQLAALFATQHLRTQPDDSLIRRRYGGGVGNRCRWVDRFALSEQRQFSEQAFPAESGTLPHRPWAPMPLVNGRGPASEALREGWSEAEVCAEELPRRGGPCMEDNAAASGSSCELANPAQMRQIASQTGVLFSAE